MASDQGQGNQGKGERLHREAIVFGGPVDEQREFLQSLVTNDVAQAATDRLVYAALLTPQGKYLSDFLIRRTPEGDYILDVTPAQADALAKRLSMYKLRRPVTVERRPEPVAVLWGDAAPTGGLPDPRDPALGWRVYGEAEAAAAFAAATPGDYDLHRLSLAIPESEADLIPNDTYVLEAGFERMNGVDFKKGCYVGQEIVARMKHKTELRKGYVPVKVSATTAPGETILNEDARPVGTLYSNRDGIGLALLRYDRAKTSQKLSALDSVIKLSSI